MNVTDRVVEHLRYEEAIRKKGLIQHLVMTSAFLEEWYASGTPLQRFAARAVVVITIMIGATTRIIARLVPYAALALSLYLFAQIGELHDVVAALKTEISKASGAQSVAVTPPPPPPIPAGRPR